MKESAGKYIDRLKQEISHLEMIQKSQEDLMQLQAQEKGSLNATNFRWALIPTPDPNRVEIGIW